MKRKHMILIYILLMLVAIFSACSKKEEKSDPIIIDQPENSSKAANTSSNPEVTPTEVITEEPTTSEEDNNAIKEDNSSTEEDNSSIDEENSSADESTLPEESNSIENSSETDNTSVNDSQDSNENNGTDDNDTVDNDTNDNNNQNNDSEKNDIENDAADNNDVKEDKTENSDQNNQDTTTKKIIAIDAGHQSKGNYDVEPIGPGSTTTKAKVSSGTQGVYTGVPEYKLNLVIAKKVEEELINRGYEVFMIRETHDVNLSNRERAEMANESGADLFIRIHADGSTNPDVNGASTLYPSKDNPYVSNLSKASLTLSDLIIDSICESTGAKNRGAIARDDMSGINWCTLPVTIIEMGYMSNKKEDKLMQTEDYQNKIVKGICDGIDNYYE